MNLDEIKNAVEELNLFLTLDPVVELDQRQEDLEQALVFEMAPLFRASDEGMIDENVLSILRELFVKYKKEVNKRLTSKEIEILTGLGIIQPVGKVEKITDEVPLDEQILNATKISELKEIAMTHDIFKSLRGRFASYKTTDALANAMLDILDIPEKQKEKVPEKEVEKVKEVEKTPKEEVKVQKPTKEKNEKEISFAKIIDDVVKKGGKFEDMIAVLRQVKKERNLKVPVSIGVIKAHINYRLKHNPDYFKGIVITAEGITYGRKN